MFAKSIVLSDAFLDMPLSARCLYFTLGMMADDDGFVSSPKAIMRQCGASKDDMNILLQKRYILGFESGVIVIKHWRINNYLREDRHKNTTYIEELSTLDVDLKGSYTECANHLPTTCQPLANQVTANGIPSIGKDSIGKDSIDEKRGHFVPPTIDEVYHYCIEKSITHKVNPERFVAFYESKGWFVGKNKMKDWKAAVRNWASREQAESSKNSIKHTGNDRKYTEEDWAAMEREALGL